MFDINVRIAGIAMNIRALCPETKVLFKDYLTEEPPLFTIESTEERISAEQKLLQAQVENGSCSPQFSPAQAESNYLYRDVAERLSEYHKVLLHGSAIAADGRAYVFVAPSGTGKSTHTRLWRETFGERVVMVNDDKPLLTCSEDGIFISGSPWNGKHHLSTNITVPLEAVCFLHRGKENEIESIASNEAFLRLLTAVYHSTDAAHEAYILESIQQLRRLCHFYSLHCNMNRDAALIAYKGMAEKYGDDREKWVSMKKAFTDTIG